MHRRSPRFAFRAWILLVVSLVVPPACSGSSRNVDAPKPVASASASVAVAAPPPRDPCEVAADLRKKVKPFLDEGRLHRTVKLIVKADRLCPRAAPETYAALVTTLAELGKYAAARKIAARIEADPNASVEAKAAARSAKDTCEKLDKVFPDTDDAKKEMKRLYREAFAAEQKTDPDSQKLAKEKYLAAWEAWRPNGQALLSAGFAAKKLGQVAEAQRLFDRAIVDGETAQGSKVTLEVPNGFSGDVNAVAWSPDGRLFAVAHGIEISIFDTSWREKLRLHSDPVPPFEPVDVTSLAFAPDSKTLTSVSRDSEVTLWDVATGMKKRTLTRDVRFDDSTTIAYLPNGKTLALLPGPRWVSGPMPASEPVLGNVTVRLWEVATDKDPRTPDVKDATSVAYSPNGKTLASGSEEGTVRLSDAVTGKKLRTFRGHVNSVQSVAYAPDGKTLATGSANGTIQLWDVATGQKRRTLTGRHRGGVGRLLYSPDGKTLVSVSKTRGFESIDVKLWDVTTGKRLRTFEGERHWDIAVAYSPDGKTLAMGQHDAVRLWDIATGAEIRTLTHHARGVSAVAYSPDGKTFASGSGNTLNLWDTSAEMEMRVLRGHAGSIASIVYAPDGKTLASGSSDTTVKLWDVATGKETRTLTGHAGAVNSVAYSPEGKAVASGSDDKTVKLWDATTGKQVQTLTGHEGDVLSVAYAPDGKAVASGSGDGDYTVKLWDVTTGKQVRTLPGDEHRVYSVTYSPDGKTLASGSYGGTVKLWDVATGEKPRDLAELNGGAVAYSPDGKVLASGAGWVNDGVVMLWDVATGKKRQTISVHAASSRVHHGEPQVPYAFLPDGKALVVSESDGSIRVYRVKDGIELIALRALADKNAHYAFTPNGHIDIRGEDACSVRQYPVCRIGAWVFPFDVCEERFYTPGLFATVQSGDTSYLEPENAPKLVNCP